MSERTLRQELQLVIVVGKVSGFRNCLQTVSYTERRDILLLEIYHSTCGLGDPETSAVKTASVCNKASVSVGFFVNFGAAKNKNKQIHK